jgi:hypothetical protein
MLEYFRRLYATGTLDVHGIEDLRRRLRFRVISEGHPDDKGLGRYRLIDDVTFPAVVATWDAHRQTVERLLANLRESPTPRAFPELGRFQVNLRHYELAQLGQLVVTEAHATRVWRGKYDEQLGLLPEMDDVELIV